MSSPSEMPTQFDLRHPEPRLPDRWTFALSVALGVALGTIASLLLILSVLLVGVFLLGVA